MRGGPAPRVAGGRYIGIVPETHRVDGATEGPLQEWIAGFLL